MGRGKKHEKSGSVGTFHCTMVPRVGLPSLLLLRDSSLLAHNLLFVTSNARLPRTWLFGLTIYLLPTHCHPT